MLPSSADLTYFVEVGSTLNLSRAAERLGITQPSLTLSIQRLEHQMRATLLHRSKKGVTLTPAGKKLLLKARQLIEDWERIQTESLRTLTEVSGVYKIGCHPSVGIFSLPSALNHLLSLHPELDIRLAHNRSRNILEDIISFRVDVGVVVNPTRHPDLVIQKVCVDEVALWTAKKSSSNQNLHREGGVLICDDELSQTQTLLRQIKKKSWSYRRTITSSSLEVIAHLTLHGAGIGILPSRVASAVSPEGLRRYPQSPTYKDEICVVYRVENRSVRAIQTIVQMLVKSMPSSS